MNAPRAPLKSLDQALAELLAQARLLAGTETVRTFDADGRVLAQDLVSALHVPPQDNSAMDGYALRCADVPAAGTVLQVTQRIPAGHHGHALEPQAAARIFTGAPVPPGADDIVMQEDCEVVEEGRVRVNTVPQSGQWIRRAGEDVTRGAVVLARGQRLGPAALGMAAGIGLSQLTVVRRPRVALFSTGDELVMPGDVPPEQMAPGAIYNSNRFFLRALLQRLGCEVTDYGIVPDQRAATLQALQGAAEHHDLVLTSGGVSVGEEDHIKPAVQQLGELDLWQISMKPGKPFAYGKLYRNGPQDACHFAGLPGNPVSSYVTFMLLVRPFLLSLQGVADVTPVRMALPAHFELTRGDKRREFLRVRRNAAGGLDLFPNQSSGVLTSAAWGDGLVDNPANTTIAKGDIVQFISFAELMG
ncbi:MAG: molybdopterin molybdotransferase MoeA [Burkholderiales bacterium]|nr:molybdopterin molybdotransferase MoeA [Burkholderiales bacterium]